MKKNSIVTKLWIAMTILMLLVIGVASAAQTSFMEKIYYQYQIKQLLSIGTKVENLARTETDNKVLDMKIDVISNMIDGNVMIIGKDRIVLYCQGMGISSKDIPMDINNPHHGLLTKSDLDKLFNGETVIYKGRNSYFKTDVLSVSMPVNDPQNASKAIMIHAPLKPLAGQLAAFKGKTVYTAVGGIILAII